MNQFKQITTSADISNWFCITLCQIFQLFSSSKYFFCLNIFISLFFMSFWKFIIKVRLSVIFFLNIFHFFIAYIIFTLESNHISFYNLIAFHWDLLSNFTRKVCRVGLSTSKKVAFICFNEVPLKMIKKYCLFYVKNSFRSQNNQIFALVYLII